MIDRQAGMTRRNAVRTVEPGTQQRRGFAAASRDGVSWPARPYGIELADRSDTDVARLSTKQPPIQCKLSISSPGDPFEREADHAADQVMRMAEPASVGLTAAAAVQRKCARCEEENKSSIQAKRAPSSHPDATAHVHDAVHVAGQGGAPMPRGVRGFFESRFGHDFSTVRVHTGREATDMARTIRARAYTVGRDIVFGSGQYAPATTEGRWLLAHELAHVVQQTGRPGARDTRGPKLSRAPETIQRAVFEDHCNDLPQGTNCGGTIDVHGGTIGLPAPAVSHLYIVYTSRNETAIAFRGGPEEPGPEYGHITTQCGPYVRTFIDYDTSDPSVRVYSGEDACLKAQCLHDRLQFIAGTNTPYAPRGPNSNSVVAELLHHCGLPLRMPVVTAPGFNMGITEGGAQDLGTTDRRQRLSVGIGPLFGGPSTGLGLTAGYSVDVAHAANQTVRFPLRIGALYDPLSSTALGSAAIGAEIPLVNLPFPGLRVPTSLGLFGGVTGGVVPGPTPGSPADGVLGPVLRPNLGFDVGRVRLDLFYQYQYLRSLGVNRERSLHLLGLEVGYTF